MKTQLIGIDPSFTTMGLALWVPDNKELRFKSGKMLECFKWMKTECDLESAIAVIENPALNSTQFKLWEGGYPFFIANPINKKKSRSIGGFKNVILAYLRSEMRKMGKQFAGQIPLNIQHVRSAFAQATKHAEKVGENKAAAKYIIDVLSSRKIPYIEIAPSERHRADISSKRNPSVMKLKRLPTKTTQPQFEEWVGFKIKPRSSNGHSRDAATLVVNRSMQWAEIKVMEQALKRSKENKPRKRLKNI